MKNWQRPELFLTPAVIIDLHSPGQAAPMIAPEAGVSLDQRVSGLENSLHYTLSDVAQLKANLEACGQALDVLSGRIDRLAVIVAPSALAIPSAVGYNPPGS